MQPLSPGVSTRRVRPGACVRALLAAVPLAVLGAVGPAWAAWATLNSEQLGIVIDHPSDWRVETQGNGAIFRSPRGETIELRLLDSIQHEPESATRQCTTGRFRGGGSVRTCWDPMSTTRIAYMTLAPGPRVRPWILVTTDRRSDPRVFDRMVDSLRLRPGSRPR